MSSTIFVGNLPLGTSARSLAEAFQDFGTIVKCEIPPPKDNFKTIFGFVEFTDISSAKSAVESMNAKEWNGNIIKIAYASSRFSNNSHTPPISRGGSSNHLPQEHSYDSRHQSHREDSNSRHQEHSYDSRYDDGRRRYNSGPRPNDRPNYRPSGQDFRPKDQSYSPKSPGSSDSGSYSPQRPQYNEPRYNSRGRDRGRVGGRGRVMSGYSERYSYPRYSNRHDRYDRPMHSDRGPSDRSPRRNYGYDGRYNR